MQLDKIVIVFFLLLEEIIADWQYTVADFLTIDDELGKVLKIAQNFEHPSKQLSFLKHLGNARLSQLILPTSHKLSF